MLEWKPISSGLRPVPTPAATSIIWTVTVVTAFALVTAFNLLDGHGDPTLDLVTLSILVALLSTGARLTAAPGTALLCWLVLNAFATAPIGVLTWEGAYDLVRLVCLLASAGIGTVVARIGHARAAYQRLTP
ncbi:hypothetical protein [Streptomyces roseicoloratus]|uniref:Histidine kinase n=1 Tax=Streptomyces roseicoloratus TaxID=2508722 RepID=A0ABY9RNF9_9ACTN|nr:hypothetical protein [Streptomyces roseicoloratus]WMX43720.1 hypothetical protein RGF97_00890 [Streptomyces roseicoloratus]